MRPRGRCHFRVICQEHVLGSKTERSSSMGEAGPTTAMLSAK
jgi:hypothetical protein